MTNENTKKQIRDFIEAAIEKVKNPDKKQEIKRIRQQKAKKVLLKFGL